MRGRKFNVASACWGFRRRQWWASKTPVEGKVASVPTNPIAVAGQTGRPVATPRRFDLTLSGALNVLARIAGLVGLGVAVAYFAEVLPTWGSRSGATALDTGATPLGVAKVGAQPTPGAASAAPADKPQSFGLMTGASPCATAPDGRPRGGAALPLPLAAAVTPLAPLRPRGAAQAARAARDPDLQSRAYAAAWELERHQAGLRPFSPVSQVGGAARATRGPLDPASGPLWGSSPLEQARASAPGPASGNPGFGPLSADYRWRF
jgi:hypothetical protein